MADMGVSGFWGFMWFVAFCFITDQYRLGNVAGNKEIDVPIRTCMGATIAFSLFSIFLWVSGHYVKIILLPFWVIIV